MRVLGIDVPLRLAERWRGWLMPALQPYRVPAQVAEELGLPDRRRDVPFEVYDAFELYGLTDDERIVTVTRRQAQELPAAVRRAQPTPHRWPTMDAARDLERTVAYVRRGRRDSRHAEIDDAAWRRIARTLPGARAIAGTFADRSGPNCFGAVMAATGIPEAAETWMQIEDLSLWMDQATVPGGDDDVLGTVLLWRDETGSPAHAAVTLGGGYALHKPSQGWMSPTKVLTVRETIASARSVGLRLSRRHLR